MIDPKFTKAQLISKLIVAEIETDNLKAGSYKLKRERDSLQETLKQEERQTEDALRSLSHIRQSIETAHAVCYPLCSLEDTPDPDDPKDFNLLKYLYRLACRF